MLYPVDVTESLFIVDYGHVMQQTIKFLFTNRFSQFLLQKIQQSAGYKHNKKD